MEKIPLLQIDRYLSRLNAAIERIFYKRVFPALSLVKDSSREYRFGVASPRYIIRVGTTKIEFDSRGGKVPQFVSRRIGISFGEDCVVELILSVDGDVEVMDFEVIHPISLLIADLHLVNPIRGTWERCMLNWEEGFNIRQRSFIMGIDPKSFSWLSISSEDWVDVCRRCVDYMKEQFSIDVGTRCKDNLRWEYKTLWSFLHGGG